MTAILGMVTEDDDSEGARTSRNTPLRPKLPVNAPEAQKHIYAIVFSKSKALATSDIDRMKNMLKIIQNSATDIGNV